MIDRVPVIDITEPQSTASLGAIDRACREWGFFQVTGHAIDDALIADLFASARAFFSQSREVKRAIVRSADNPWGFFDEELTKNTRDWKEIFDYGPGDGAKMTPQWPQGLPDFEAAVLRYYDACEQLAHRLLACVCANLGMPADHLSGHFTDAHTSFLRLNFYPPCRASDAAPSAKTLGINPHSDAGALTVLAQDRQPGLEVYRDGTWFLVEPIEGALVINIGDIVQVWSNDRYKAPLHRVITNSHSARYSAPFFFNPSYATHYAPLPSTVSADNPARYRPISWREFRALRAAGDYADYGNEVQITDYRVP